MIGDLRREIMKSLNFESQMENDKKVMVTIFWTNRKAAELKAVLHSG
jgi:hypothetical protein